ncbi:MAG: porin family protein [Candidatus Zixiibacteriota bacterium]
MRKVRISIAIIALLLCFSSVHAQFMHGFGVKTGVVLASQDIDNSMGFDTNAKSRTGFDLGVFAEWFDSPVFSLSTEAHYVQKGMIEEVPRIDEFGFPMSPSKDDHRIDYLSIPVLAKISVKGKHISPYLVFGPRFDFLLGNKSKTLKILYDELKNTDEGLTAGVGVETNTVPLRMLLEFRYSPDFSNAYKTDLWKIRNNSFEILSGLKR